jgi:hypothetical protein
MGSAPAADSSKTPVAHSNDALKTARKNTTNTMHFAAQVIANHTSRQLTDMLAVIFDPIEQDFEMGLTKCATMRGTFERNCWLARGGYCNVLRQCVGTLADPVALADIGYTHETDWQFASEGQVKHDQWLSNKHFEHVISLVRERYLSNMLYTDALPGRLFDPESDLDQVLHSFKVTWLTFEKAEKKSADDAMTAKHLQQCIWPLNPFCLEQLVRLRESNFSNPLDTRVAGSVQHLCSLPLRTHLVEKGFHDCRVRERTGASGALQEVGRWTAVNSGSLLKDNDWPPPAITPTARSISAKGCPKSMFHCKDKQQFSLGADALNTLNLDPAPWPTPSPETFKLHPLAWKLVEATSCNWVRIQAAWLSLLVTQGCVLMMPWQEGVSPKVLGIVVASTVYGLLLMPCSVPKRLGRLVVFEPKWVEDELEFTPMSDLVSYRVARTRGVSPLELAKSRQGVSDGGVAKVVLTGVGAAKPPLQHAAEHGFATLNCFFLNKLISYKLKFGLGKRPTTEMKMAEALVRDAFPDWDDAKVAEALAHRNKKEKEKVDAEMQSLFLDGSNLEAMEAAMDDEDLEQLKEARNKFLGKGGKGAGAASSGAAAASANGDAASGSAGPSGKKKKKQPRVDIPLEDDIDVDSVRKFLPVKVGCGLTKDVIRHYRWVITYPNERPPFSVSKSWNQIGETETTSFYFCLRQVWLWHTKASGQECPWEIPEL